MALSNTRDEGDDGRRIYTEADIRVISRSTEAVRRRPGMYIGGTDARALHHLVHELVNNSISEALAGHGRRIEVTIHADGSASVADDGRGIPVGEHPHFPGKSTLEVVLTTMHY